MKRLRNSREDLDASQSADASEIDGILVWTPRDTKKELRTQLFALSQSVGDAGQTIISSRASECI